MSYELIAGRAVNRSYQVRGKQDIYDLLVKAVEQSGGLVLYKSSLAAAPFYLGVQVRPDEQIGMLIYPFRMKKAITKGRPSDEFRAQLRYGSEKSWDTSHPLSKDVAGVDVTLVLGIDVEHQLIVGLDANLWDPLPMGISFYAKSEEMEQARLNGWHVWEAPNKAGSRRKESRSPTGFETVVAFTPDRLLQFAKLERRATSLRLDPPLRYVAASSAPLGPTDSAVRPDRHTLEEQFQLSSQEILDIIGGRNRLSVAVRGGVAEHHLEQQLTRTPGIIRVERLDIDARHDFNVTLANGRSLRVECKNASPKPRATGEFKVEVQKTRASKNDPASRFYPVDSFDVVAACLFSPCGVWDFKFGATSKMTRHDKFRDRLAPIQTISQEWVKNLIDL